MNIYLKKIFIVFFVILFLFLGTYLIIRVQGLVLNTKNFSLIKTGGLYLNYTPKNAEVKINGIPRESESLMHNILGSGIFVDNLIPGNYQIEVSYPQYYSWIKTLPVAPGFVTVNTLIHLFPKNWDQTQIATSSLVTNFWLANGNIIIQSSTNLFYQDKKLKGSDVVLSSPQRNTVLTVDKNNYYLINLNNPSSTLKFSLPSKDKDIFQFIFHPFDQNAFLGISKEAIYYFNFNEPVAQKIYTFNLADAFYQKENKIFIAQKNGKILIIDLLLRNQTEINTNVTSSIIQLKTTNDGSSILFLTNNNQLYEYNLSLQTTTLLLAPNFLIKNFYPSLDGTRLAILPQNENNIYILALKDFELNVNISKGTLWKIKAPDNVDDFTWTNFALYGIFLAKNKLFITDLDQNNFHNQYLIAENITNNKIVFLDNKLYLLQGNKLNLINLENY